MRIFRSGISQALQLKVALGRIESLIRTPLFWILTVWGNSFILIGAALIYKFEGPLNPLAQDFMECLIWSVGLVTTVGASNIVPVTLAGKIVMLAMMMGGAVFLWSYMALFIGALVDPELKTLEDQVSSLQEHSKQDEEILHQLQKIIEQAQIKKKKRT